MEQKRIGVFVCHCGINIGGVVDVPEVAEYARTLPDVVCVDANLFTCSEEGVTAIRDAIKEHDLTRVVVASCTPRTHEPLFRAACEAAGLNKYVFDLVNIRDQCSWVHMKQPGAATDKAKDLVRMGVGRVRALEPLDEIQIPVEPAALVIGGGVTGMTAALNLAEQGFVVHLVEQGEALGGLLRSVHRVFPTDAPAGEVVASLSDRVAAQPLITTHLRTRVSAVTGFIGNFTVTVTPEGAAGRDLHVGAIVVAVGAEEHKPGGEYRYGELPNVITQLELEQRLKAGQLDARRVVMINCVGARIPTRTSCSRFCCMTAVKNASLIRAADSQAQVHVLHRDMMTYGTDFEDYYRRSMEQGVRYVRYDAERPPQILGDGRAERVRLWHELLGREVELPADLVVLTTPLRPRQGFGALSQMLKVPLSEQGFFLEAHLKLQPVEFATEGIYICGSARWPTPVSGGIMQAQAAAAKAAIPLRRGYVKPEAATAVVDEARCAGCGMCVPVCAYKALELVDRKGRLVCSANKALCKGCGTCAATCPSGSISINHFKDAQIVAQLQALFAVPR